MSLFLELKRRNVLRVAIAYLAVSWLLIQVVETLFPIFGLSDELIRLLVILLIIGFPLILIVSWLYELTPEGVMTTAAADAAGYAKPATFGRHIDFVIIAMLVIAVGWLTYERESGPTIAENSIAVLPFVNMSHDPEQEYFSDGVAEEILNMLAQVGGLKVTARTSSFQFKGQTLDVPLIGAKLNVAAVLEGSVRKSGDVLRITAQLISTADGFNLWSKTYDRRLDDIFAIQDEIAASIVDEMRVQLNLTPESVVPLARIATTTEAYDLYLQGLYQLNTLFAPGQENTNMDAPAAALELFRRATVAAPDFAPAWAGSARALSLLVRMDKVSREDAQDEIDAAIENALALGPNLAEVQFTAGEFSAGRDEALQHFDRAIEINPNYGEAHVARAHILASLDRYRESFEASEIAFRVDPLRASTAETALYAHFYQGKTDGLEERLEASIQNQPTANGLVTEAHIRFELGQFDLFPFLQRRAEEIPGFGVEEGNWIASAPRLFGDTYLTLGLTDLARSWMVGRYDDAIFLSEGRYGEAIEYLKLEREQAQGKTIYMSRWQPDIDASLVEAYLYAGRYEDLAVFLDALSWRWWLPWLPGCCLTNPPWPEVAYTFALFQTGRTKQAQEWLAHMSDELEDRLEQGVDVPNHYYELARIRVMQERIPEAFAAMERAIEKGWRRWYFDLDPILEPIRTLPEFAALEARYDADIDRMRDVVAAALAVNTPGTAQ